MRKSSVKTSATRVSYEVEIPVYPFSGTGTPRTLSTLITRPLPSPLRRPWDCVSVPRPLCLWSTGGPVTLSRSLTKHSTQNLPSLVPDPRVNSYRPCGSHFVCPNRVPPSDLDGDRDKFKIRASCTFIKSDYLSIFQRPQ